MRFCALIVKELLRAIRRKNFLLTFIRTYVKFYVQVTVTDVALRRLYILRNHDSCANRRTLLECH
jgi:hypothetical protein